MKSVLFDLDDTLVDHLGACRAGLAAVRAELGGLPPVSVRELELAYREILSDMHPDVVHGRIGRQEARLERFRRFFAFYGCPAAAETVAQAQHVYKSAYLASRRTVPGAHGLLEALHGRVKIGIVTDNVVAEQVDKLQRYDLERFVDELVVSEEVGVSKPDPTLFRVALERLGCKPEDSVMVGDSWERDVLGAQPLGIACVWLNRYSAACPDPGLATEIDSLEPVEQTAALLLGNT